jgi:hypothetical protein
MLDKPNTEKPTAQVYALTAWSVKQVGDKWYIAQTACFENKPTWSKPYASLHYATTAIARKLAQEVLARQKWRTKVYGATE